MGTRPEQVTKLLNRRTMTKREFKATEGLLHDVMRKQAGSVEKAILEAIMNSVDANATEIIVTIDDEQYGSRIIIEDDGDGLTREDIRNYFEQFGYKDDDIEDKEFGKFRMGRGQIFNFGRNIWHSGENLLVVDLNNDTTEVHQDLVGDIEEDEHLGRTDSFYEFDSSGLSYIPLNASSEQEGCRIEVDLYDELEDVKDKVEKVADLAEYIPFVHDVQLTINDVAVESNLQHPQETGIGWYSIQSNTYSSGADLYNKGAKVGNFGDWPADVVAVSKEELDVNFARNDVLDTCDVWKEMKDELNQLVAHALIQSDDVSSQQSRWMIETAATDSDVYNIVSNKPLVPDVDGKRWTLSQLKGEKIVFASTRSETAKRANRETEYLFISDAVERQLSEFVEADDVLTFEDAWGSEMRWEMTEIDEEKLSKKRGKRLAILRWVARELGCYDDVVAGMSSEQNVWRNGEQEVVADKEFLNTSKDEFFFEGLVEFVRILAHEGSTMEEFSSDFSYKNHLHMYMKEFGEVQRKAYNGQADI